MSDSHTLSATPDSPSTGASSAAPPDLLAAPQVRMKARWLPQIFLLLIVAAGSLTFWYWKQWTRPGLSHYFKGTDYAAAHQYDKAEQEWKLGVQEDPKFPRCYEALGDLYLALRAYPQAAANYTAATKLTSGDGSLWLRLARTEQTLEHYSTALAAAKRAAELLPNDADAQGEYGILSAKHKDRAVAIVELRKAHALRPDDAQYMMALANTELDTLDLPGAERDLTAFLQRHPNNTDACFLMAVIFNQKPRLPDNLKAAINYGERALPALRGSRRLALILGQLYLDAGRGRDALRLYQEALRFNPDVPELYHGLVNCYHQLGDKSNEQKAVQQLEVRTARDDRLEHLRHVLGFNPRNVPAALELAHVYEVNGDYRYAQGSYELLYKQFPHDARVVTARQGFYHRIDVLRKNALKQHQVGLNKPPIAVPPGILVQP